MGISDLSIDIYFSLNHAHILIQKEFRPWDLDVDLLTKHSVVVKILIIQDCLSFLGKLWLRLIDAFVPPQNPHKILESSCFASLDLSLIK